MDILSPEQLKALDGTTGPKEQEQEKDQKKVYQGVRPVTLADILTEEQRKKLANFEKEIQEDFQNYSAY